MLHQIIRIVRTIPEFQRRKAIVTVVADRSAKDESWIYAITSKFKELLDMSYLKKIKQPTRHLDRITFNLSVEIIRKKSFS